MKLIFRVLTIVLITAACTNSATPDFHDQFSVWASQNAQEIETLLLAANQDDINSLEKIVGNAELVCLGESRHDIKEQFQLKNRFVRYLIEEMGFTSFVLEASLPSGFANVKYARMVFMGYRRNDKHIKLDKRF